MKSGGQVSARLGTQPLGEARMLAKQKLMARMQKVWTKRGGQVSASLGTQPLGEARMLAKLKLEARIQKV